MGAMRLAKKYDAPKLLAELQNILLDLFPESYSEAQRKLIQYHALESEYADHASMQSPETYDHEDAIKFSLPNAGEIVFSSSSLLIASIFSHSMGHPDGRRPELPRHSPYRLLYAHAAQRYLCRAYRRTYC